MKKQFMLCFIFLLLIAAVTTPAQTTDYSYPKEKPVITVTYPDNYQVINNDEGLQGFNEDISVALAFCIMPGVTDIKSAVIEAHKKIEGQATDMQTDGEVIEWETHGIKCFQQNETGTRNGKPVYLTFTFLKPDGKTPIVAFYIATPEADKKYEQVVNDIMDSIRKPGL